MILKVRGNTWARFPDPLTLDCYILGLNNLPFYHTSKYRHQPDNSQVLLPLPLVGDLAGRDLPVSERVQGSLYADLLR